MNATNSFSFENQTEQGPLATLYKVPICFVIVYAFVELARARYI
jgi:hypothetical protein